LLPRGLLRLTGGGEDRARIGLEDGRGVGQAT